MITRLISERHESAFKRHYRIRLGGEFHDHRSYHQGNYRLNDSMKEISMGVHNTYINLLEEPLYSYTSVFSQREDINLCLGAYYSYILMFITPNIKS